MKKYFFFSLPIWLVQNLSFRLVPEALGYLHIKEDMAVMLSKRPISYLFRKSKKAPQISLRGFLG